VSWRACNDFELIGRTLISGMFQDSLARIREAEPTLRLAGPCPVLRRDYTTDMLTAIPALAFLTGYRAALPRRALAASGTAGTTRSWLTGASSRRALVRAVAEGGGELYVWTVDDARMIDKLTRMGVDGIITNDPRLFDDAAGGTQPIRHVAALNVGGSAPARPPVPRGGWTPVDCSTFFPRRHWNSHETAEQESRACRRPASAGSSAHLAPAALRRR